MYLASVQDREICYTLRAFLTNCFLYVLSLLYEGDNKYSFYEGVYDQSLVTSVGLAQLIWCYIHFQRNTDRKYAQLFYFYIYY